MRRWRRWLLAGVFVVTASAAGIYCYGASSELPLRVGMAELEAYEAMGRPLGSRDGRNHMYLYPKPDL
jgi:hypothetical protein